LPLFLSWCLAFFFPLLLLSGAGWPEVEETVAGAAVEASSRAGGVGGAGVGLGAGLGARSDRPALVEWRSDAGVLPLGVEPDRPDCRRLAGVLGCVSSSRPPRAERDGVDATTCTER
jgi:hypothetical protein